MRGPVIRRVVNVPMRVEVQQEPDGTWVAVLPGYSLSPIMAVGLTSEAGALQELKRKLRKVWRA